jgi:hypothetical protein
MNITRIAIIDVSASMDGPFRYRRTAGAITRVSSHNHKFEAAKEYLRFAIQKMPPSSELIVIAFAESARVIYQGTASNTHAIERAMATLQADGSSTNLGGAFQKVLDMLSTGHYAIRPLDVVTDGLSNEGDPIEPARRLQKEFGAFIHIYLIDPTEEGKLIADQVVGSQGEGEVDPVASAGRLLERERESLEAERELYEAMEQASARHHAARQDFLSRISDQERPKMTAAYPEMIATESWSTLDLFLYLSEFEGLVRKEVQRLEHREDLDYSNVSAQLPKSLPKGCQIRVSLSSNTIQANPSELTISWLEPYNRFSFRIIAMEHVPDESSASLDIEVFADNLPIASMRLPIAVNSMAKRARGQIISSEAQWYETIFASYAREDLEIVRHLKERYEMLGLQMFIDLDDLRSGAFWRPELFKRIDSSDLFQLFWSTAARESEYVEIEWKRALGASEVKGGSFIRPIYWEVPIPDIPEELAEINFRRIDIKES